MVGSVSAAVAVHLLAILAAGFLGGWSGAWLAQDYTNVTVQPNITVVVHQQVSAQESSAPSPQPTVAQGSFVSGPEEQAEQKSDLLATCLLKWEFVHPWVTVLLVAVGAGYGCGWWHIRAPPAGRAGPLALGALPGFPATPPALGRGGVVGW